jgi:hypothetical protein
MHYSNVPNAVVKVRSPNNLLNAQVRAGKFYQSAFVRILLRSIKSRVAAKYVPSVL